MKPELLSPCHDFATLRAAVESGADAVYFGVKGFNMRAKAGNFELNELKRVVSYCHENRVRAYLATNVVVYEDELGRVKKLLGEARKAGVDAVIVHDLGVLRLAVELGLDVHISTQANTTNSIGADTYAELGASRVILSRELLLEQVRRLAANTKIDVEVFIHGAMCVSISGRCFLSQAIYGANANLGECYQPCRQEWFVSNSDGELIYDGERFLNSKDLCMIEYVPELLDSGVKAFKIEGRMRDADYVSTVTSVYREAIDDFNKEKVPVWKDALKSVFNRGYCTGFYYGEPEESGLGSNQSTTRKVQAGIVSNYYKKVGAAELELTAAGLSLGDEVIIESKKVFLKQRVESLEINHEKVEHASKGERVGLKTVKPVKQGAIIYKLETIKK
ncbi:U32 family peptidase [archaeon]|nr:U32 family peptidase [archaeon]